MEHSLLEKLTVPQLAKILAGFYGTGRLNMVISIHVPCIFLLFCKITNKTTITINL